MRFTLTYDGELPSTGNKSKKLEEKWSIRKQFDPQLRQLWKVRSDLAHLKNESIVAKDGRYIMVQPHPSHPAAVGYVARADRQIINGAPEVWEHEIDLCAPLQVGPTRFLPLVRNSLALTCSLKVLFLRQQPRGRIIQSGDLDNRIKTLLDALCVPPKGQVRDDLAVEEPIYCLLEDDSLITGIDVRSEQLLSRPQAAEAEVHLVIEVDVRVAHLRAFNTLFLGD